MFFDSNFILISRCTHVLFSNNFRFNVTTTYFASPRFNQHDTLAIRIRRPSKCDVRIHVDRSAKSVRGAR